MLRVGDQYFRRSGPGDASDFFVSGLLPPSLPVLEQPVKSLGAKTVALLLELAEAGIPQIPGRFFVPKRCSRESFPLGEGDAHRSA